MKWVEESGEEPQRSVAEEDLKGRLEKVVRCQCGAECEKALLAGYLLRAINGEKSRKAEMSWDNS